MNEHDAKLVAFHERGRKRALAVALEKARRRLPWYSPREAEVWIRESRWHSREIKAIRGAARCGVSR